MSESKDNYSLCR
jgi:hypothetical protein